jgi:ABC-type sugar transport system ATPase subunit
MDSKTYAIEVENLQKSYKKVKVLQGVSFAVEQGAIFALLEQFDLAGATVWVAG